MIKLYKAYCTISEKVYIGQTSRSLSVRIREHVTGKNKQSRLYEAILKYGLDSFEWEVVHVCSSLEEANQIEVELIEYYNSFNKGYNSHKGGRAGGALSPEGMRRRQASRQLNGGYTSVSQKQSEDNVAKRPEVREKISNKIKMLWEDGSYRNKRLAHNKKMTAEVVCPHCSKVGSRLILHRWHFNRCKFKK